MIDDNLLLNKSNFIRKNDKKKHSGELRVKSLKHCGIISQSSQGEAASLTSNYQSDMQKIPENSVILLTRLCCPFFSGVLLAGADAKENHFHANQQSVRLHQSI